MLSLFFFFFLQLVVTTHIVEGKAFGPTAFFFASFACCLLSGCIAKIAILLLYHGGTTTFSYDAMEEKQSGRDIFICRRTKRKSANQQPTNKTTKLKNIPPLSVSGLGFRFQCFVCDVRLCASFCSALQHARVVLSYRSVVKASLLFTS
jgi:hypothetical protein